MSINSVTLFYDLFVCFSYEFLKFSITGRQTWNTVSIYRPLREISESWRSIKQITWVIWTICWDKGVKGIKNCLSFLYGQDFFYSLLNGSCGLWDRVMNPWGCKYFVLSLIIKVWNIWRDFGRIVLVTQDSILRVYCVLCCAMSVAYKYYSTWVCNTVLEAMCWHGSTLCKFYIC